MHSVRLLLPAAAALLLAGCGGTGTTAGTSTKDALYFASTNVPVAYTGETYSTELQVAGGVGPYNLRLASGTLPPGLTLTGRTLTGKATKTGQYTFTLEASDAALSTKAQAINLTVSALPPLSFAFALPTGEIRGETRLPLSVTAPRGMRAFRLQWVLPAGLSVTRVTPVDTRAVAFWKVSNDTLTLDVGFRTGVNTGDRLVLVSVKPSKPMTLAAQTLGYTALGGDGKSLQQVALPAPAKAAPTTVPGAPTAVPGTTPPTTTPPTTTPPTTTPPNTAAPGTVTPDPPARTGTPAPPVEGGK